MTRITALVVALLWAVSAHASDKTPCWKIRKWVHDYGESAVMAYAKMQGYSQRDIERGKRCLK